MGVEGPPDHEINAILEAAGVDWLIWYPATHPDVADSLVDIETKWSLVDLLQAHRALAARARIKALVIERATAKLDKPKGA